MLSEKQLAANRLNAQKSTGPRTLAGKAASSLNALKSGIHAESHIIKGERSENFEALSAQYFTDYHPATAAARALVDSLIANEWLLRRLRRIEADIWNCGIEFLEESEYQSKRHLVGDTFANKQETLARLQRRIDSLDRAWHRALKVLRQLGDSPSLTEVQEETEPAAVPEVASTLQPLAPYALARRIGFVPHLAQSPATTPIAKPPQPIPASWNITCLQKEA